MLTVFFKYPHLLDEEPGAGDLKTTTPPRRDEYVRCTRCSPAGHLWFGCFGPVTYHDSNLHKQTV